MAKECITLNRSVITPANTPTVTLCLGSASYQMGLAQCLLAKGMLARGLRVSPIPEVLDANGMSLTSFKDYPHFAFLSRVLWAAWRRLPGTRRSLLPVVATSWLADRLISRSIPSTTIFHGLNGNSLRSLRIAKDLGAITVLESRMMHPRRWQREVLQECQQFGVHPRDCGTRLPSALIRRLEREYQLADRIVVPSSTAKKSFEKEGISNVDVILPGVDVKLFHPSGHPSTDGKFRVCYTGRIELAKGTIYLLEAWKRLQLRDAELLLIGEVRPELKATLRLYTDPNITFAGFVPRDQVAELIRGCSLFVFPSLHEGLALAMLEAMASGLPVIATEESAAQDCVTEGLSGYVVRSRHPVDLADRIAWACKNRDELAGMGRRARARIESMFTLTHYEERMIEYYRLMWKQSGSNAAGTPSAVD